MKIVSIKFQNLNSLKGDHEIRFDKSPFTESGLFAITGPTGAGKTTILDAITVALYGRVHRHNKDASEIMTRHTAECYSEVEFEVKRKIYRAKWSLRRSRGKVDGALQGYKMELSDASTGELLGGHTTTLVQQAIVDLCGLDYNQFLRSVMLSQGDFTRFLKADENERSELLEKITDTGIYSEISKFTFAKTRQENEKLETLQAKLSDVELLSAEERNAYDHRLSSLSIREKEVKAGKAEVEAQLNWLKNLFILNSKKVKQAFDLERQQDQYNQNFEKFQRLASHNLAIEFKPALVEIRTIQDRLNLLKADLEKANELIPVLKTESEYVAADLEKSSLAAEEAQAKLTNEEPLLEKIIQLDSLIENLKDQVARYLQVFKNAETDLNSLASYKKEKARQLEQIQTDLSTIQIWLRKNQKDSKLDKQMVVFKQHQSAFQEISIALISLNTELSKADKAENEDTKFLAENDLKVEQLNKDLQDAISEQQLLESRLLNGFKEGNLELLENEAKDLPSLISNCEQQLRLSKSFLQFNQSKTQIDTELSELKISFEHESAVLIDLKVEKEKADSILNDYRQLLEAQQRIQKYDADRLELKPEKPCPLCGSVHHPYIEGNYSHQLSEAERKKQEHERYLLAVNESLNKKILNVNTLELTIKAKCEQLEKLEQSLEDILQEFTHINTLLPKPLDILKNETIQTIILRKKEQLLSLHNKIREIRAVQQKVQDFQKIIAAKREALLQTGSKAELAKEKLIAVAEQKIRISHEIGLHKTKQSRIVSEIEQMLREYNVEFDGSSEVFDFQDIELKLTDRFENYSRAEKQQQQLQLNHTQFGTELKKLEEQSIEKKKSLVQHENEFKRESEKLEKLTKDRFELFGVKNPAKEREILSIQLQKSREIKEDLQRLLQQKQEILKVNESKAVQFKKEMEESENTLNVLSEKLRLEIKDRGIESVQELKQLFLPSGEAEQISSLEKQLSTAIATLEQLLKATELELSDEQSKEVTSQSIDELQPKLNELDQEISDLNQEIGRLRQILEEDSRMKVRFEEVAAQMEIQKKEHSRWLKLSSLIGSADGKKFSRFAQGLTLARLTDLANRHLSKLTDRYRILKSPEKDLEIQIIDAYQADVVRPMTTLSGGESFLVSLALALGLSDLASRKVQINSLFIDEGFGTLDADTLDIAISALENLQAKGKSIGIISHVEALKERIGIQIQVSKQPGGTSKIKLTNYSGEFTL